MERMNDLTKEITDCIVIVTDDLRYKSAIQMREDLTDLVVLILEQAKKDAAGLINKSNDEGK